MEQTVTTRQWKVRSNEQTVPDSLSGFHPIVAELLRARGVTSQAEAQIFFEPDFLRDIHNPFLFSGMQAAVNRIFRALECGERITIHGDYDADGVTGSALITSVLHDLLRVMGRGVEIIDFYIPHREREGYGVQAATIDILGERGTKLIVTVDCGIACRDAIGRAKDIGIDTIVVDHHEFARELPEAILIHPRLPGEAYPFPHLAAVGVSWKVACALYEEARRRGLAISPGAEKWLLDLVAIATVTDVVPLIGENRALEHFGLTVLRKTRRLGLEKLFAVAGIRPEKIDTFAVGFQIGPRINAAGRMDHAEVAFRLLMAGDVAEAEELAQKLHNTNLSRQQESNRIFDEARAQIQERVASSLLWAHGEGWSPGLVGLVAGKLVQEFGKPVLVMGRMGDRVVGSGRSVPGFHITEALREVADCLERFGGHPQACGFTIFADDRFPRFLSRMEQIAREKLRQVDLNPMLMIDAELDLNDLTENFIDTVVRFGPHGEANPVPRFLSRDLAVASATSMGVTGKHLRLRLRSPDGKIQKFVGFGFGRNGARPTLGAHIDVVYEVSFNEWNGSREVQCKLIDWRVGGGQ